MKKKDAFLLLFLFFFWRIFLFIPLFVGDFILKFHKGYEYVHLWKFVQPYFPVNSVLLYPWANFDGIHYLMIASQGYSNNLGFMPLFPIALNLVANLFGGGETFSIVYFLTGFFLANIFFLISLFIFFKLLRLDYSKSKTLQTIIFLVIFPTSFFFGAIYSESMFLLLTLLSFYFARKGQWFFAGIVGFFLPITRIVGIFILPALIVEFFQQENILKKWKKLAYIERIKIIKKSIPIFFIPLSIVFYSIYNYLQKGDYLYFLHAHGNVGNSRTVDGLVFIPQTVYRYFKILISVPTVQAEWWVSLLEITVFLLVIWLLILAFKYKVRLSYLVFAALCFLLPVSSGTFSGLPRYALILFPIFIAITLATNKTRKILHVVFSILLLFILLMFFSKGCFIA